MSSPSNSPSPAAGEPRTAKRIVVCLPCRESHKKCDGTRPCARCLAINRPQECVDPPATVRRRKGEGRPHFEQQIDFSDRFEPPAHKRPRIDGMPMGMMPMYYVPSQAPWPPSGMGSNTVEGSSPAVAMRTASSASELSMHSHSASNASMKNAESPSASTPINASTPAVFNTSTGGSTGSSSTNASGSTPSGPNNGSLSMGALLLADASLIDGAKAIDLCCALSEMILRKLLECRSVFVSRFGAGFGLVPEAELRRNILGLSENDLSFLDTVHEAEVGESANFLSQPPFSGFSPTDPVLVYRSSPTYAYIHQLLLHPRQLVTYMNDAFEQAFGWQVSKFRALKLEPSHIVHPQDIVNLVRNIFQACLRSPAAGTVPVFTQHLRIMCADGTFRHARVQHYSIRSSDMTPVYGVALITPLEGLERLKP